MIHIIYQNWHKNLSPPSSLHRWVSFFSWIWINDKIDGQFALWIYLKIKHHKFQRIQIENAEHRTHCEESIIISNYTDIHWRHISSCRTLQPNKKRAALEKQTNPEWNEIDASITEKILSNSKICIMYNMLVADTDVD